MSSSDPSKGLLIFPRQAALSRRGCQVVVRRAAKGGSLGKRRAAAWRPLRVNPEGRSRRGLSGKHQQTLDRFLEINDDRGRVQPHADHQHEIDQVAQIDHTLAYRGEMSEETEACDRVDD